MNKKIVTICFLAVFMLVAISFATAIYPKTTNETKESPLFRLRTTKATAENISNIIENIKTKFLGERIFFLPFTWIINKNNYSVIDRGAMASVLKLCTWEPIYTCASGPTVLCYC